MTDLDTIRSAQEELLQEEDRPRVSVSSIAGYFIPDHATGSEEDKSVGTARHKSREEDGEVIAEEEAWDSMQKEVTILEWPIVAEYPTEDVVIIGKVDGTYFKSGTPRIVLERKYPRPHNLDRCYESEIVQAWTYCRLFDLAGFNTSELSYFVVKTDRAIPDEEDRKIFPALQYAQSKEGLSPEAAASRVSESISVQNMIRGASYDPKQYEGKLQKAVSSLV